MSAILMRKISRALDMRNYSLCTEFLHELMKAYLFGFLVEICTGTVTQMTFFIRETLRLACM